VAQNLIHGDESLVVMINLFNIKFVQKIHCLLLPHIDQWKFITYINLQTRSKYVGVEIFWNFVSFHLIEKTAYVSTSWGFDFDFVQEWTCSFWIVNHGLVLENFSISSCTLEVRYVDILFKYQCVIMHIGLTIDKCFFHIFDI
jgi:hypothetical protein